MPTQQYGQIVGNTCIAVISFDPDLTPVAEMAGTLNATLLPIGDYADGQWGIGAYWDGIDITPSGQPSVDVSAVAAQVAGLQLQVDDLTNMVLEI